MLPRGIVYVVFVAVLASLPLVARSTLRLTVTRAMELAAVALMTLIPGTGEAYFIVPAIWGAIHASTGFWIFSGVAYLFLLTGPEQPPGDPRPRSRGTPCGPRSSRGARSSWSGGGARREAGPA